MNRYLNQFIAKFRTVHQPKLLVSLLRVVC